VSISFFLIRVIRGYRFPGPLPFVGLIFARRFQRTARFTPTVAHFGYCFQERASDVPGFFHERLVFVQGFVTGGVGPGSEGGRKV
jgi:hypothetical protein